MIGIRRIGMVGLGAAALLSAAPSHAASPDSFYQGKTVELLIGAAAGGAYDLPGRVVARHIGRHIPGNPSVVVKNMQGGNSLLMTNHLYNIAARDGTIMGIPNNSIPLEPLLKVISPKGDNVKFDVTKFNWIGSVSQEVYVSIVWHTVGVRTIDDARKKETLTGSTGSAGEAVSLPRMLNALAGTKLKLVKGYAGQSDIFLAMERGEVQANTTGLTNLTSSKADWMREGKLRVLVQYTTERSPMLKDVPAIMELVRTDEDRDVLRFFLAKYRIARTIMAPPDVPADRVRTLRAAFDATVRDKGFLAESAKVGLPIDPVAGADVAAMIQKLNATPTHIVERTRSILLSE